MTFLQIFGLGLVYLGIILAALIIISALVEIMLWSRERKRQKEKSKQPIRQIHFDRKI